MPLDSVELRTHLCLQSRPPIELKPLFVVRLSVRELNEEMLDQGLERNVISIEPAARRNRNHGARLSILESEERFVRAHTLEARRKFPDPELNILIAVGVPIERRTTAGDGKPSNPEKGGRPGRTPKHSRKDHDNRHVIAAGPGERGAELRFESEQKSAPLARLFGNESRFAVVLPYTDAPVIPLYDINPPRTRPRVTKALIIVNVVAFVFVWLLESQGISYIAPGYGLVPTRITLDPRGEWFTVLTSMFLHGGLAHLGWNMLFLYIFGDNVEDALGPERFLAFYLLSGIGAALGQYLMDPWSSVPMIGASGAIGGVLGGYLVLHPRAPVAVLNPIPLMWLFMPLLSLPA